MTLPLIHRVTTLDLQLEPFDWPFARERRAEIDAHFAEKQRERPGLWNGRVLLARRPEFGAGRFSARYFEIDFASLLAWRDWGFPEESVFNIFGMGAIRASDGAFVMGEMGHHTANAGRVYFPAGTPDLDDIKDGMVDIAGNVAREVEEETGLTQADYRLDVHWDCVVTGRTVAMMRLLHVAMSGEEIRARIEANIARQTEPELASIRLVRSISDLTDAMPLFVTAFVESQFA
jgi:8-oxo-dGTP pyrophosphatase MutT (NUDIX family)